MPERKRKKSGIVRIRIAVFRATFRVLCATAPGLAVRLAGRLFRTPPRRRRRSENEHETLATGERLDLSLHGQRLAVWRWGRGPRALLVHGWGSRGARLSSFVRPLVEAGFSVVAFDAPGHGASEGRLSSLPEYIAAIEEIAQRIGAPEVFVAHSMGGAASAIAIKRGIVPKAAVFLAPAANPGEWTERFAAVLRIPDDVIAGMKESFERQFGYRWDEFDVPRAGASLSVALLVFHDKEDAEVPWNNGAAITAAWPGAELVTTEGLGHKLIAHDPEVVRRAVAFLRDHAGPVSLAG
jgi:pimeloyl-ACP methyl ester carboxylesterase